MGPVSLWKQMGWLARIVVIVLFLMSGWSIGIMIDRALAFSAARSQSRAFAPAVAGALKDGKIEEAIKVADRNKKSHLAKVVSAGLQEFKAHGESTSIRRRAGSLPPRPGARRSHRSRRAEARPGGLATIGSTAPFVGLFGTVVGILNAFKESPAQPRNRSGRRRRRHLGSPGHHRHRSVRRDSGRLDVQLLHRRVEAFDVEMENSSSELIDYFLKRRNARR